MSEPKRKIKFRYIYFGWGITLSILLMFLTNPDNGLALKVPYGAQTINYLLYMLGTTIGVGVFHLATKAFFDYVDYESIYKAVKSDPKALAEYFKGLGLFAIALAIVFNGMLGIG